MLAVSGGGLMVTGSVSVGAEYFAIPLTGLVGVADSRAAKSVADAELTVSSSHASQVRGEL